MTEDHVWRQIEQMLACASQRVILVAPFIKKDVFKATLAAIPSHVHNIRCVTRWSVAEVAAGVSDPEIADLAAADGRASIALCHDLHAKLYVADDVCLIGSANLTGKATGRAPVPNIELLIETSAGHPEVQRVLRAIEGLEVPGTVDLAHQIREQANLFQADEEAPRVLIAGHDERPIRWLPETRNPTRLYGVYNGRHGKVGPDVLAGILRDLATLDVAPGLGEQAFGKAVLSRLRAIPEVQRLVEAGRLSMDDVQRELMGSVGCTEEQARRATETIAEWLRYFDEVHLVPIGPWEIRQGREIT
ncbi:phospholipase D family protein [Streptomyces sp. NPDC058316]|uniref:phospholipase D family protein n=1 Tax=Streptomyces sp. NPDC058316 TaxID=3346442 RepID=UPI0036F0DC46